MPILGSIIKTAYTIRQNSRRHQKEFQPGGSPEKGTEKVVEPGTGYSIWGTSSVLLKSFHTGTLLKRSRKLFPFTIIIPCLRSGGTGA